MSRKFPNAIDESKSCTALANIPESWDVIMVPYEYVTICSRLIRENRGLTNFDEDILVEKKCACPDGIIVRVYITIVL